MKFALQPGYQPYLMLNSALHHKAHHSFTVQQDAAGKNLFQNVDQKGFLTDVVEKFSRSD